MLKLNNLIPHCKSKKNKKRLGRGIGSGSGKTCGRGHKGQSSRSGKGINRGFEGGQTSIFRRLPKFGFISCHKKYKKEICFSNILNFTKKNNKEHINLNILKKLKLINNKIKSVKIIISKNININDISFPIKLHGLKVSKKVRELIYSSGGEIKE